MNEEDIKILEQYIKSSFRLTLPENVLQAIENLINRNKELEEDYTSVYLKGVYDERDKWKSKIKEKIEELKEKGESDLRTYGFAIETHLAKQVLQELLERRK